MYNINVNKITRFKFPNKQTTLIKGIHCGLFSCLLLKDTKEENSSSYILKKVAYNSAQEQEELECYNLDIFNEAIVSELEYLTLVNSVFIATSTKALIIDFKTKNVNTVYFPCKNQDQSENDKVIAAAWNCEQDSLAVAYNSGKVMVYCMNYLTFELKLLAEDHPDHKGDENVYLGWGDVKKQFKGKGDAAYLRENQPPESSYRNNNHDGYISWQYGERYFSVNSLNGDEHIIRIFDNECRLFYTITNMKVPGIASKTIFRSKHNMLATICQNEENSYVVLHERNGGYHNKIIPFNDNTSSSVIVQDVKFSTCGRLLSIQSQSQAQNEYFVDIYFQSNFIWLHKHRFCGSLGNPLISYKFGNTDRDVNSLEMVFKSGVVTYEIFKSVTYHSDNNTVYVVNSNTIQEFDYKMAVIPPCGVIDNAITLNEPVNKVILHSDFTDSKKQLIVVDTHETAHVFIYCSEAEQWQLSRKINLKPDNSHLPVNWYKYLLTTIDGNDCLITVGVDIASNTDIKKVFNFNDAESGLIFTKPVAYIHKNVNTTYDSKVNIIDENDFGGKAIKTALSFIFSGRQLQCILTCNGLFYIDKLEISDGVTSMLNYQDLYLLLTITTPDNPMDRLLCLDIQHLMQDNLILNDMSWSRKVEKCASLICLANDDGGVILEMPRGNIELVAVRPIILRNIFKKIEEGLFREAYHIVRRNSMKPDVLYDLAPNLFHQNINEFVKSLGSTESVIKFLLPLKNTSTLTRKDFLFVQEHSIEDKKNKICDAIIQAYKNTRSKENMTSFHRVTCIALIVKHNHDTYEALKFLVDHFAGRYNAEALLELADAVSLLKIYGDVNEMYRQALTLYDIELVATIAQLCGMDPQIYRRFLEVCRLADPHNRRFLMANEGGNYKYAGLYMLILLRKNMKTMQEFLEYIKEKGVIEDVHKAMNKGDGEAFVHVTKILVDKYLDKAMYKEAAYVLCKAGLFVPALELLNKGVCYNEALELISYVPKLSVDEKICWYGKVADACTAHGKYKEAADIFVEKCGDIIKGLDCCLERHLFQDAVDLLDKQPSSIDNTTHVNRLRELLIQNVENCEANFRSSSKNFDIHYSRLKIVREERKYRVENNLDGDDAYSEAGSVTTRSHTSASTTTRRTRKLEMKLRSLRHGGKFEDIALMRELYEILNSFYNMTYDLNMLYDIYVRFGNWPNVLYNNLAKLQEKMYVDAQDIWPSEYSNLEDDVLTADFLTENIALLDKIYRSMPPAVSKKDIIKYT